MEGPSSYQQEDLNDASLREPMVGSDYSSSGARQRGGGRIGGNQPYYDNPPSSSMPQHHQFQSPQSIISNNNGGGGGGGSTVNGGSSTVNGHGDDYDNDDKKNKNSKNSNSNNNKNNTGNIFLKCCSNIGCVNIKYFTEEEDDPSNGGKYYYDNFYNDYSRLWFNMGTSDDNGIWMNTSDQAGTIMSIMVWFLLTYSIITVSFLAHTNGIPTLLSIWYTIFCCLALASHAKTTLTDPGSVPISAVPPEHLRYGQSNPQNQQRLTMCSQCQTYKPLYSHHCRICNRCISRMDHHCPWMNNCIGVGNMKHFILFLLYTWTCSVFSLVLLGWNYFFCNNESCTFHIVLIQLVRIMTLLSIGAFLFTSSMIMNVSYGMMTGIGTIDRLKKKATNQILDSDEEPIPLKDVFGIGGYYTWFLPIDPIFDNYDRVMGYSTPQRLLREQMIRGDKVSNSDNDGSISGNTYYTNDPYYNDAGSSVFGGGGGGGSYISQYTAGTYNTKDHPSVISQNAFTRM